MQIKKSKNKVEKTGLATTHQAEPEEVTWGSRLAGEKQIGAAAGWELVTVDEGIRVRVVVGIARITVSCEILMILIYVCNITTQY